MSNYIQFNLEAKPIIDLVANDQKSLPVLFVLAKHLKPDNTVNINHEELMKLSNKKNAALTSAINSLKKNRLVTQIIDHADGNYTFTLNPEYVKLSEIAVKTVNLLDQSEAVTVDLNQPVETEKERTNEN